MKKTMILLAVLLPTVTMFGQTDAVEQSFNKDMADLNVSVKAMKAYYLQNHVTEEAYHKNPYYQSLVEKVNDGLKKVQSYENWQKYQSANPVACTVACNQQAEICKRNCYEHGLCDPGQGNCPCVQVCEFAQQECIVNCWTN